MESHSKKILLNLSIVSLNSVILYKKKITHAQADIELSNFLGTVKLDNGSTISVSNIAEVLVGKSLTDTECISNENITYHTTYWPAISF